MRYLTRLIKNALEKKTMQKKLRVFDLGLHNGG